MNEQFIGKPIFRRLRGYAFDPSLSVQLDTALLNSIVFNIPWEEDLQIGPVGEYLEVVDYDPASQCFYKPVDLNHKRMLAKDGVFPSESNPQFHQQMVYSVAMTTIEHFENALGREALWSSYRDGSDKIFVRRLRIYPHALREANAYYSPAKKALLFGYFPASGNQPGEQIPHGLVYTCLSHDIIAHETTHALLDGMHRRFIEDTHPDTLAFHEAFADIIALFQHFTYPEVLRHQIAKTRGDLASQNLLGQLAQQFGKAIGNYGALRDAIGEYDKATGEWKTHDPSTDDYATITEPHDRGAILVAAVFEAFLSIYKRRVADLLRLATSGTGVLPEGELHPDLVNRLATEASKTANHILSMCIRALDYCPPVDITFGDYLRAVIAADMDIVPNDDLNYRIAFIEAFRRRGIYPKNIRSLSEESLRWKKINEEDRYGFFKTIAKELRGFVYLLDYLDEFPSDPTDAEQYENFTERANAFNLWVDGFELETDANKRNYQVNPIKDREKIFKITRAARKALSNLVKNFKMDPVTQQDVLKFEKLTGLYLLHSPGEKEQKVPGLRKRDQKYTYEVHSMRASRRTGPDGKKLNRVFISITQHRIVPAKEKQELLKLSPEETRNFPSIDFRGGCTLVLDLDDLSLKYVIRKDIDNSDGRLTRQLEYQTSKVGNSLRATYFDELDSTDEPFSFLHRNL